jgi:predicted DNA-binding protein|tara:strand:+ start:928 stop:1068 length:141 start_codon:yes stop_codon:yes gene_type:complete
MVQDETIVIKIDKHKKERLKKLAAKENRTLSGYIKHILEDVLKKNQ